MILHNNLGIKKNYYYFDRSYTVPNISIRLRIIIINDTVYTARIIYKKYVYYSTISLIKYYIIDRLTFCSRGVRSGKQ